MAIQTMTLDDAQKAKVREWIHDGLKLSDIQSRLIKDYGLTLTYMEVRFLVDDLKLVPKDPEVPKQPTPVLGAAPAAAPASQAAQTGVPIPSPLPDPGAGGAGVKVSVDEIVRPGALASGKVTFSDGGAAGWYLDQTGRLGLVPGQPGYKPPSGDLPKFQMALEAELAKLGF